MIATYTAYGGLTFLRLSAIQIANNINVRDFGLIWGLVHASYVRDSTPCCLSVPQPNPMTNIMVASWRWS